MWWPMTASLTPRTFAVRSVGSVARRCLKSDGTGRVVAAFGAAIYFETGPELICIGTAAIEPGPVNLVTSAPASADWSAMPLNGPVVVTTSEIRVTKHLRFPFAGAVTWAPEAIKMVDPALVASGLAAFRKAARYQDAEGGIGRFIDPGFRPEQGNGECRAAMAPISEAQQWLAQAFGQGPSEPDQRWVRKLTGLGQGLTPSGDDFLGGVMIALHALGCPEICRILWTALRPCAERSTNEISLTLLKAASDGQGSASLHRALQGILCGDPQGIHSTIPLLDRIGHSSGWDAMTGVVVTVDAWLRSVAVCDAEGQCG